MWQASDGGRIALMVGLLAALGVGSYLLFFVLPEVPTPGTPAEAPATPGQSENAAPGLAEQAGTASDAGEPSADAAASGIPLTAPAPELPALTESDASIRPELEALLGDNTMTRWLHQDQLIQRLVAWIAGLQKGALSQPALLLEPPSGEFLVERRAGHIYPSPRNYERYAPVVGFIEGIDAAAVAEIFHLYRPLFEDAYGELGQPPEQFGDAVLGAIDHLLGAPEPAAPPELIAESVAYRYADQGIEDESDARKQLIRMGPAHTATVKDKLRALRKALLTTPEAPTSEATAPEASAPEASAPETESPASPAPE